MSLAGKGVVAIWHDLTPEVKPDFYQWHNREHMPERLAIPGFRRGRRFIAPGASPEYFNLYEADSKAVVAGEAYLARLNDPTQWTRRVVPGFRNTARSVCAVEFTSGVGLGGTMLTLRFDAAAGRDEALARFLTTEALPAVAAEPGVSGVHFCRADEAASGIETAERKVRAASTLIPRWIVLVEGVSPQHVEAARVRFASDATLVDRGAAGPVEAGLYVLEHMREPGTR